MDIVFYFIEGNFLHKSYLIVNYTQMIMHKLLMFSEETVDIVFDE